MRNRLISLMIVVAAGMAFPACSLLLDFSECESDDDCSSGTCVDQVCVGDEPECEGDEDCPDGACQAGACVEVPECVVDSECGDAGMCTDGTCETMGDECSSDTDCDMGSCVNGTCQAEMATTCAEKSDCNDTEYCLLGECKTIDEATCGRLGPTFEDNVNIIPVGGLLPLSGPNGEKGQATADGAELAFSEINSAGAVGSERFGLIVCDTQNDTDIATTAAEHLVDDLGVQAIVGAGTSGETIAVAQNVTIDAGVLLISPAATSPAISDLPDDDLVWRTIASDALQGPALADLAADKATDAASGNLEKIAVLAANTTYGNGLFELVTSRLNEIETGFTTDDTRFTSARYDVDMGSLEPDTISTIGSDLFGATDGFQPNVVMILGSTESQQIINAFEQTYDLENATEPPLWILTEAGKEQGILDAQFDTVWDRIFGTSIQQTMNAIYQSFQVNYSAAYQRNPVDFPFSDKAYDAGYLIGLVYAVQADPVAATGVELAAEMKNVSEGDEVTPGTSNYNSAVSSFSEAGNIDFRGASGDVDFDNSTGDVQSTIVGWEIDTSATDPEFKSTGTF